MGAFLQKPKRDKQNSHGVGNGLCYGLSSMQGWRMEMEDAHCAVTGLPHPFKEWSFFAIFDGHAGARVSAYCAQHLLQSIVQSDEFEASVDATEMSEDHRLSLIKQGIRKGFLHLDDNMRNLPEVLSGEDKSGTTAVCSIVSPSHVFIANCGDSRAVLSVKSEASFSTQDHKPTLPAEKARIQNAGGSVMIQRVNGSLAVSRALGDYDYKKVQGIGPCEQIVSPEPEIFVLPRSDQDEFLVLACDGVWDVMTNEDVCQFIRSRLEVTQNLETICNEVVDLCLERGSRDNMSIVLVTFEGAPKLSDEAVRKEAELEDLLTQKVKESVEAGNDDLELVLKNLSFENIPNLPPVGGLLTKKEFVEKILNSLRPPNDDSDSK